MNYNNTQMKIDQLVAYLNEEKINLSPAFQRGHVWTPKIRRKLLSNMIQGKPIPAIFLYKEPAGAMYSYNILDGKQRIESVILFVTNSRSSDLKINRWDRYFVEKIHKKSENFWIEWEGKKATFKELPDSVVRNFREYAIPTVEIHLDDDTTLDQIISLFVDINQQGVPVKRFSVVKAMYQDDPLLKRTFDLIAIRQKRGQDVLYRTKRNDFTTVLKKLQTVSTLKDNNSRVDRMWEILLELALFVLTQEHRKPVEILRGFISKKTAGQYKLSRSAEISLRRVFAFLNSGKLRAHINASRFLTDQTHFYSLVTAIIKRNWPDTMGENALSERLAKIAGYVDSGKNDGLPREAAKSLASYIQLSKRQTTDVAKRKERETLLSDAIERISN
jgi:hypothetical protein